MNADFSILLAEMQADFLDELPDRCDRLEQGVLALEQRQSGAFDELYRQVHSLKGAGGMFSVPVITTICHQFESFLAEVGQNPDGTATTRALAYVDLLRRTTKPAGREPQAVAALEQALEKLRASNLSGRAAVLLVEPSEAMRKLYSEVFADPRIHLVLLDSGLAALERMLHEPFDLVVASRELSDLNATAVLAAVRESRSRNRDIPTILISSNPAPAPAYLKVLAVLKRDPKLIPKLGQLVQELLTRSGR